MLKKLTHSIFILFILFISSILFSCSDLASNIISTSSESEKTFNDSKAAIVKISGALNFSDNVLSELPDTIPEADPQNDSKTMVPYINLSAIRTGYVINIDGTEATSEQASITKNLSNFYYTIGLPAGSTYSVEFALFRDGKKILSTTETFSPTVDDPLIIKNIVLKPITESTVPGILQFVINGVIWNKLTIELDPPPSSISCIGSHPARVTFSPTNKLITYNGSTPQLAEDGKFEISPGSYTAKFTFYVTESGKPDKILYSFIENINIFSNLTTDKWISNSDTPYIDPADPSFINLNTEITNPFEPSILYVDGTNGHSQAEGATGTWINPFNNVADALKFRSRYNKSDMAVYIAGTTTETESITVDKNIEISQWPNKPQAKITRAASNTSSMISVSSGVTATLEDVIIDGNNIEANVNGAGINNQGTLTLNNVTVTKCKSRQAGGAIYENGSLTINGGSIDYCSANTAGGIYIPASRTAILNNASITNNTSNTQSGGISVFGNLIMNGGTISSNTVSSGFGNGIYVESGTFSMTGNAVVADNNEVYLDSGSTITCNSLFSTSGSHAKIKIYNDTLYTRILSGTKIAETCDSFSYAGSASDGYYITAEGKLNKGRSSGDERFGLLTEPPQPSSTVYLIDSLAEFKQLQTWVTSNDFTGVKFKLNTPLTIAEAWTPIGDSSNPFKGTFDGGNKQINMGTQNYDSPYIYTALFGVVENATIKNVSVSGTITNTASAFANVGGIIGVAYNSTILNCTNNATITGGQYTGGIVGRVGNDRTAVPDTTTITGCTNTASITGGQYVGGIAGYSVGGDITGCTNGLDSYITGHPHIGLIVGYLDPAGGGQLSGNSTGGLAIDSP